MKFIKILFFVLALVFLGYLFLPDPDFPIPPADALQSFEPADTETSLRRGYYTNLTRDEIMTHYLSQLTKSTFLNIPLPTYRLNYPPEEAQTIIRDQTKSTFLEEIVHPFRESVYINGYEPKDVKIPVESGGRSWRQKIIVRQVPSRVWLRVFLGLLTLIAIFVLFREYRQFPRPRKVI